MGVIQIANGINSSEDGESGIINTITDAVNSDDPPKPLSIAEDETILRFKLQTRPQSFSPGNGLLHFVTEYESMANLFHKANGHGVPEYIRLEIDRVEVVPDQTGKNPKKLIPVSVSVSARDRIVELKKNRHYIPILRNAMLPAGKYKSVTVYFKEPGTVSFDGKNAYPLFINKSSVSFLLPFEVQSEKVTTLHSVPVNEYSSWKAKMASGNYSYDKNRTERVDALPVSKKASPQYNFQFNLHDTTSRIGGRISQVYINMKSISVVNSSGQTILLSSKPTIFELMSLLNGAVALMGHDRMPPGEYSSFQLNLEGTHTVVVENTPEPLTVEFKEQYKLNFMGPFTLRGGRITEVFLKFEPDRSIFYMENRGYILDPTIETDTVISMTSAQDQRLLEALGQRSNLVVSESELMFQGTISSLNYVQAQNIHGKNMIYSDMSINVEDKLRSCDSTYPANTTPDPCALGNVGSQFAFRSIGGTLNGMKLNVTGMPKYTQGDKSLFFIKRYGNDNRWGVVRGEWGKVDL